MTQYHIETPVGTIEHPTPDYYPLTTTFLIDLLETSIAYKDHA